MTKIYAIHHHSNATDSTIEVYVSSLKKAFDYIATFGKIVVIHNIKLDKWYYEKHLVSAAWKKTLLKAKKEYLSTHFMTNKKEWYSIETIQIF